jgi:multiple antibiotic resistance protein
MVLDYAISALLTLFVVVDPLSLTPTFLALTDSLPADARRSVASRASIIAGFILVGTALIGDRLLAALAISLPAFRISGGLLLFWISAEMLFGVRMRHEGETAEQAMEERARDIAAFPLAIPLLAGPGALTATILLSGRAGSNWTMIGILIAVVLLIAVCCWITFIFAKRISGLLGKTGNIVLSRLLGVLLAALAVQYVIDGIRAVLAR